ncbi:MAG: CBS domain-containing protein [Gemmatales bacterium]|nr:CBS domain-containing protein [Gemmatales bacterium]MDW8386005.1 CBS domain-containing protein [Gemmatales bacterium]
MKNPVGRKNRLYLDAETAADLMVPNPISIEEDATVREAIAVLIDRGFSAAPVIDAAGRPVGVISRTDIVRLDREKGDVYPPYFADYEPLLPSKEKLPAGFQIEVPDTTRVKDIMTPIVFAVPPSCPVSNLIEEFLSRKVHRLFVVDEGGALVGVISALDILRHLRGETD